MDKARTIVDSDMTLDEALVGAAECCPKKIRSSLKILSVEYYSFDNRKHSGQFVLNQAVVEDVKVIFELILKLKFPVQSAIPMSDPRMLENGNWSDDRSMELNNSYGFFYRVILGTNRLSKHSFGIAVDINPMQNPFIKGRRIQPPGGKYTPEAPGTFTACHPVTILFKKLGWVWGGDWNSLKDYHHFEKNLKD